MHFASAQRGPLRLLSFVRSHGLGINMGGLFLAGLMPWQKHSFPTSSGPLSQLIFQYARHLQKVVDHASVTGQR
jgi:hypothetical protein